MKGGLARHIGTEDRGGAAEAGRGWPLDAGSYVPEGGSSPLVGESHSALQTRIIRQ